MHLEILKVKIWRDLILIIILKTHSLQVPGRPKILENFEKDLSSIFKLRRLPAIQGQILS